MSLVRSRQIVYGARLDKVDTKGVALIRPTAGATTQEDANHLFDERITALENGGGAGPILQIDCGTY